MRRIVLNQITTLWQASIKRGSERDDAGGCKPNPNFNDIYIYFNDYRTGFSYYLMHLTLSSYITAVPQAAYYADRRSAYRTYPAFGVGYPSPPRIYHHSPGFCPPPYYGAAGEVHQGVPVGTVGALPPHRREVILEECAYCGWERLVVIGEMRFRCDNCNREQSQGMGFGKRGVVLCSVS